MNYLRTAVALVGLLVVLLGMDTQPLLAQALQNQEIALEGRCRPTCGPTWTADAEWLFWNVRAADLDFAMPTSGVDIAGRVYDITPGYSSGLRVGLERNMGPCSVAMNYTYYAAAEAESLDDSSFYAGTLLVPTYADVNQSAIRSAETQWDFDYQLFDLVGAYTFCAGDHSEGAIYGGFRAALIDEEMSTVYGNAWPFPTSSHIDYVGQRTDMSAYGVNLGVRGACWLGGLGKITTSVGVSPLVGNFDRRFFYSGSSNGGANFTTDADILEQTTRMVGVLDLSVGYEMLLFQNASCDATIGIGYEFHQWLNYPGLLRHMNESGEITIDHHASNLGIDGANVALTFSY